ncbi:uncharacterized protein LOC127868071 [Dreissena polymorpha]|nr:uncharacterized protein LOC127868071 [Dreissena polymorpha]
MWLPASLPPHCKIIVSSLPEEKYEKFPALKEVVGFAYIWFYEADNRSVVMEIGKKLYLFDLEQINFSIVFPGIVSVGVGIVTKQKQLLVTSRFGKNVKLYTITNGCVDAIIKTGYKEEIYQVVISFYTFLHSMP